VVRPGISADWPIEEFQASLRDASSHGDIYPPVELATIISGPLRDHLDRRSQLLTLRGTAQGVRITPASFQLRTATFSEILCEKWNSFAPAD
jgi:hypothetical protein